MDIYCSECDQALKSEWTAEHGTPKDVLIWFCENKKCSKFEVVKEFTKEDFYDEE